MADSKVPSQGTFSPEELTLLQSLEEKWGAIWPFRLKDFGLVVLRKPTKAEWRIYQRDNRTSGADQGKVEDNLRRSCFAYPEPEAYDKIAAAYPALGDVFSNRIGALAAGMAADGSEALQDLGKDWKKPVATQ